MSRRFLASSGVGGPIGAQSSGVVGDAVEASRSPSQPPGRAEVAVNDYPIDPEVALRRRTRNAVWVATLADVARFRADDPEALVSASLACPVCLCSSGVEWRGILEEYDEAAECRCPGCGTSWRVYLEPAQALRLELLRSAGC